MKIGDALLRVLKNGGRGAAGDRTPRRRPADGPRFEYAPDLDGAPDPGEVVWAWVPYEDDPTQGKDRPVLLIGRNGDELLGVPMSSKDHDHRRDRDEWVDVGSGPWDSQGRPSEADAARVLRIDERAIRREGAVMPRERFDEVVAAVRHLHRRR